MNRLKFVTVIQTQPTHDEKVITLQNIGINVGQDEHPFHAWVRHVAAPTDEWIVGKIELRENYVVEVEVPERIYNIMRRNQALAKFVRYLLW